MHKLARKNDGLPTGTLPQSGGADGVGAARKRALAAFLCAIGIAMAGSTAAPSMADERTPSGSLAGQMLVAAPTMDDPQFAKTVIYIMAHEPGGALGLIVNEPVKDVTYAELFDLMRLDHAAMKGTLTVHYGGPVEPGMGFVLHSKDVMVGTDEMVAGDMAMTTGPDMLERIAKGLGPTKYLFALGYAGWGPNQLETEIAQGAWFVVPADPDLIFAADPAKVWEHAVARYQMKL
jgi:putative transcriptional regulator